MNKTIKTIKENGVYQKLSDAYMPLDGNVKILSADEL